MSPTKAAVYVQENFGNEVSAQTIRRLCDQGKITFLPKGSHRDISAQALQGFYKRSVKKAG